MNCPVCDAEPSHHEFDDRLGETVCLECGYVLVSNLLEETVSPVRLVGNMLVQQHSKDRGYLGSEMWTDANGPINKKLVRRLRRAQSMFKDRRQSNIGRGLTECNMILSPYLPNDSLKDQVEKYYRKLYQDRVIFHYPYQVRAISIVHYVLKENGIEVTISELCKNNGANKFEVSRCSRNIAKHLGKPWLLHQINSSNWVEKTAADLLKGRPANREYIFDIRRITEYVEQYLIDRDVTFKKSHLAACFWIGCVLRLRTGFPEYTQAEIAHVCDTTTVSLRKSHDKLLYIMNLSKDQEKMLSVDEFLAGVRYET